MKYAIQPLEVSKHMYTLVTTSCTAKARSYNLRSITAAAHQWEVLIILPVRTGQCSTTL